MTVKYDYVVEEGNYPRLENIFPFNYKFSTPKCCDVLQSRPVGRGCRFWFTGRSWGLFLLLQRQKTLTLDTGYKTIYFFKR